MQFITEGQFMGVKFCPEVGKTAVEIHMLKLGFGEGTMNRTHTFEWFLKFRSGNCLKDTVF
jgi:hypothetical protein